MPCAPRGLLDPVPRSIGLRTLFQGEKCGERNITFSLAVSYQLACSGFKSYSSSYLVALYKFRRKSTVNLVV